ncbi:hypothetical protein N658DRAFT_144177 [Parathielavia hyrcaniae]|uniref:Uncharacterized protein n=1 Tax=Parathielavia hyrcaniae TaxID=113614 RepID=A0AAN6PZJ7_9PEZI|nr:hypothetical protein N658DRAFT_144177 [Parathielavia hyrcaniae]
MDSAIESRRNRVVLGKPLVGSAVPHGCGVVARTCKRLQVAAATSRELARRRGRKDQLTSRRLPAPGCRTEVLWPDWLVAQTPAARLHLPCLPLLSPFLRLFLLHFTFRHNTRHIAIPPTLCAPLLRPQSSSACRGDRAHNSRVGPLIARFNQSWASELPRPGFTVCCTGVVSVQLRIRRGTITVTTRPFHPIPSTSARSISARGCVH